MNPLSLSKIFRLGLAAAAALVVAAPAGAYPQPVDEADGAMAFYGLGAYRGSDRDVREAADAHYLGPDGKADPGAVRLGAQKPHTRSSTPRTQRR